MPNTTYPCPPAPPWLTIRKCACIFFLFYFTFFFKRRGYLDSTTYFLTFAQNRGARAWTCLNLGHGMDGRDGRRGGRKKERKKERGEAGDERGIRNAAFIVWLFSV